MKRSKDYREGRRDVWDLCLHILDESGSEDLVSHIEAQRKPPPPIVRDERLVFLWPTERRVYLDA